MRVLIVGGGGREHALGWKIAQSPKLSKLYFAPGNPGTRELGENVALADNGAICAFCKANQVELVVVGPEAPLVDGLADDLRDAGIACFGPGKVGAELEGSKDFAKRIMVETGVPTAAYATFTDFDAALAYAKQQLHPLVVKADGLAAGKGVTICADLAQTEAALREAMVDGRFGDAGNKVVLEEFLTGTEASFHVICDGERFLPLVTAKDHKALYEGDKGPNTGGMGTFAPNPLMSEALSEEIQRTVCEPVLNHLRTNYEPFRGVLFTGLMLTEKGPKVLEFNVRFGDPETQVMLPLLDFDLLEVLHGAAVGELPQGQFGFKEGVAVCVVLASAGYPVTSSKGDVISGLDSWPDSVVFHAGTREEDGKVLTNGGRVLGLTAWGDDLSKARATAYTMVDAVDFDGKQFRKDIGAIDG